MNHPAAQPGCPLRVGAVSYLNSKPLVRGLHEALPGARITFDLPSRLADGLAAGRFDVALAPIVEYLRGTDFVLLPDACVACGGPVLSVKLFFRTAPSDVRRLALDEGSRTSAALAQVLLAELHGVRPQLERLPMGDQLDQTNADAVLMIGDRAMRTPAGEFFEVWDLGDRWRRWTGLPFVFAAWIAHPSLPENFPELASQLSAVRDQGVQDIHAIAQEESECLGITVRAARDYLTNNLHFSLGDEELRGVERFDQLCRKLGLVEPISTTNLLAI